MADTSTSALAPDTWGIVELMGHRKRAGRISEVEIAGSKFLRVDIPTEDGEYVTEYYGGPAIYGIQPGTEELVRQRFGSTALPARPVSFREQARLPAPGADEEDDQESPYDDGGA